jgi:hypothetical protein
MTIKKTSNCDPVLLRGKMLPDVRSIPGSSRYLSPPSDLLRNPPGVLSNVLLRYSGSIVEVTNRVCGPGSSVGIATGYGLDGPGIEYRWGKLFRTCPGRP